MANLQNLGATLGREGHTSRVVEVWDCVEELDGATGGLNLSDCLTQLVRNESVLVHQDVHHICLVAAENTNSAHIAGCFSQNHVAWINEELGH